VHDYGSVDELICDVVRVLEVFDEMMSRIERVKRKPDVRCYLKHGCKVFRRLTFIEESSCKFVCVELPILVRIYPEPGRGWDEVRFYVLPEDVCIFCGSLVKGTDVRKYLEKNLTNSRELRETIEEKCGCRLDEVVFVDLIKNEG
jgi:hypothetical protein